MRHAQRMFCGAMLFAGISAAPRAIAETVVPFGATWRYLDDGSDQGSAWQGPTFDDGAWMSGPAQLGYGDGDEATVVGFGPDPDNKYVTTYFRHTFTLAETDPIALLRLVRDDGAVVYLNGVEVFRSAMPDGPIDYLTPAASTAGGVEEDTAFESYVDGAGLVIGDNVLAVEVHQRAVDSSDISFDLELEVGDVPVSVTRGPYLQRGSPNEITVRWRTNVPSDGRVSFGSDPLDLATHVNDPVVGFDHAVRLTGLMPATDYYYAVGTQSAVIVGANTDHVFTTAPPVGSATPTRVWVLGDSGTADAEAASVRDAYYALSPESTDLWLMLGDNAYDDGTDDEYQLAVFDMYPEVLRRAVLWTTLGNHDGHTADSPTQSGPYYDIFTLPAQAEAGGMVSGTEAYYSFDHGNIHFVCLDSYDSDRDLDGAMMVWLESDLADTLAEWIIAFWHHPPYSKGSHDSDTESALEDMRTTALPLLEAAGVDLVLSGHSHSYERSVLLNGHYGTSDLLDVPTMVIDGGDGHEAGDGAYMKNAAGHGTAYIVAGSSGKVSGGDLDHPVMFVALNELGSVILDIDGPRMDVRFLQADGQVTDAFTMLKAATPAIPTVSQRSAVALATGLLLLGGVVLRRRRSAGCQSFDALDPAGGDPANTG